MATLAASKSQGIGLAARLSALGLAALPFLLLIAAVALVVASITIGTWVDEDAGWTNATAGAGVGLTVVALGVLLGTRAGWKNGVRLSLAVVSSVVVGLGAIALVVVTYVGGASDVGVPNVAVSNDAPAAGDSDIGAALSQQQSNNEIQPPGYSHDPGSHPTYTEFVSMDPASLLRSVPGGTLLPEEVTVLKTQIGEARSAAENFNTVEKAMAAGYYNTTNDVPFMGAHFLNGQYVSDGVFDPAKPEGLLFSKLGQGADAPWQLVGVWYLILPGGDPGTTGTIPPDGFAGNLDLWHEHHGLCTRAGIISENNTSEGCRADSGRWIGDLRWMMHVWVYPEGADNSEGVFGYLNYDLWQLQGSPDASLGEPSATAQ